MSTDSVISPKANEWFAKGFSLKKIEEELLLSGIEPRHIPEMLAEIKKLHNARKTSRGLALILIGGVLCLFSCLLTLVSLGDLSLVLFGLTTLGIIIIFAGLVQIFG